MKAPDKCMQREELVTTKFAVETKAADCLRSNLPQKFLIFEDGSILTLSLSSSDPTMQRLKSVFLSSNLVSFVKFSSPQHFSGNLPPGAITIRCSEEFLEPHWLLAEEISWSWRKISGLGSIILSDPRRGRNPRAASATFLFYWNGMQW